MKHLLCHCGLDPQSPANNSTFNHRIAAQGCNDKFFQLATLLLLLLLTSCWGIQESYDYKPDNVDPYIYKTAWEFIESTDSLSLQKEAIEYVNEAHPGFKDYYTQTDRKYTFLLMRNDAFRRASETGLFYRMGVTSVRRINVDSLKTILLYGIVDGYYHAVTVDGLLGFDPVNVISFWKSQDAELTLCMNEDRTSNFSALTMNRNVPKRPEIYAVNCNYLATNGAIHIFNNQYFYK